MDEEKSGIRGWISRRLNLTEIVSILTNFGLFYTELDTSKPLDEALAEASKRPVVSYARWPRVLGLMVVVLLAVEILTGGLLALYYLPTSQTAHASVGTILRDVGFGSLVHQIHFWGGQALVAVLIVRIVRFFVQNVYRAPRELIWVFAALLLLACLHADLTGRFLPWTDQAYWSTVRALEIVGAVPLYGDAILFLVGGGETFVSAVTLIRFYLLHVAILPAVAVGLIYLHFASVRRTGLSESRRESPEVEPHALKEHATDLAILLTLVAGVLVTLAVLFPVAFQSEADPYSTPIGVQPPWYLLAPFGFLELTAGIIPRWAAGFLLLLAFLTFLAVPFVDRRRSAGGRGLTLAITVSAVLGWLLLTIYGAGSA